MQSIQSTFAHGTIDTALSKTWLAHSHPKFSPPWNNKSYRLHMISIIPPLHPLWVSYFLCPPHESPQICWQLLSLAPDLLADPISSEPRLLGHLRPRRHTIPKRSTTPRLSKNLPTVRAHQTLWSTATSNEPFEGFQLYYRCFLNSFVSEPLQETQPAMNPQPSPFPPPNHATDSQVLL